MREGFAISPLVWRGDAARSNSVALSLPSAIGISRRRDDPL